LLHTDPAFELLRTVNMAATKARVARRRTVVGSGSVSTVEIFGDLNRDDREYVGRTSMFSSIVIKQHSGNAIAKAPPQERTKSLVV